MIQPGNTLSGIAASHGVSLAAVETANPQLSDYNLIYAGESVQIPGAGSATATAAAPAAQSYASTGSTAQQSYTAQDSASQGTSQQSSYSSPSSIASTSTSTSGDSSSSLSDIPGVPSSFASCVAYRESTNDTNPAADGDAYGIIPASGYNVYGSSLASQKQVFSKLYAEYGTSPWASDGCA